MFDRRRLPFFVALCVCILPQAGLCATPTKQFESLARAGQIHKTAPVTAVVEVVANAPVGLVWKLLADINGWPRWQSDISRVNAPTPLVFGSDFDWAIDGSPVHSRLELIKAGRRLAWISFTGSRQTIHVWTLEALSGNKTRITSAESMDGKPMPLTSKELAESDQAWLNALKVAAERQAQP
jgi:uncharacterized membrane protein